MKIFISYRRDDSQDIAGRLFDRLSNRPDVERVVYDVDNVPFGVDFREYLDAEVKQCDVLLALIGKRWLEVQDTVGRRRLDNPTDFVRIEIELAEGRRIPIVPVLVGGARMPIPEEVPETLRFLCYRNAAELSSGRDFNVHVQRLASAVAELARAPRREKKVRPSPRNQPTPSSSIPRPHDIRESPTVVKSVLSKLFGEPKPFPSSEPQGRPPKRAPASGDRPGERLLAELRTAVERLRPTGVWTSRAGWWAFEGDNGRHLVKAKPSTNLLRVRIRRNPARQATARQRLVSAGWFAEDASSVVRDQLQLDAVIRRIADEWKDA